MNIIFIIIYVVFGFIASVILEYDLVRCMANAIVGDTGIVLHETDEDSGEQKDYNASELGCDNEIVKNAIEYTIESSVKDIWKARPMRAIVIDLVWACAWPIVMPILMWFYRRHIDEFIDDVITDN